MTTSRVRQYARQEAVKFGVSPRDVISPYRGNWEVAAARKAVIRRLSEDGFSRTQIANWIGRDPSTVSHALRSE